MSDFNFENFRYSMKKSRLKLGYTQAKLSEIAFYGYNYLWNPSKLEEAKKTKYVTYSEKYLEKLEIGFQNPPTSAIIDILNIYNSSLNDFLDNKISEKEIKIKNILKKMEQIEFNSYNEELFINILKSISIRNVHNNDRV